MRTASKQLTAILVTIGVALSSNPSPIHAISFNPLSAVNRDGVPFLREALTGQALLSHTDLLPSLPKLLLTNQYRIITLNHPMLLRPIDPESTPQELQDNDKPGVLSYFEAALKTVSVETNLQINTVIKVFTNSKRLGRTRIDRRGRHWIEIDEIAFHNWTLAKLLLYHEGLELLIRINEPSITGPIPQSLSAIHHQRRMGQHVAIVFKEFQYLALLGPEEFEEFFKRLQQEPRIISGSYLRAFSRYMEKAASLASIEEQLQPIADYLGEKSEILSHRNVSQFAQSTLLVIDEALKGPLATPVTKLMSFILLAGGALAGVLGSIALATTVLSSANILLIGHALPLMALGVVVGMNNPSEEWWLAEGARRYRRFWRSKVKVQGIDHVPDPRKKSFLFASNHPYPGSDAAVIALVMLEWFGLLPSIFRTMSARYALDRAGRWLEKSGGVIVVDTRKERATDVLVEKLKSPGQIVGMFPSGSPAAIEDLSEWKSGVAWVAHLSLSPVVPVWVQPPSGRDQSLSVHFGPPVSAVDANGAAKPPHLIFDAIKQAAVQLSHAAFASALIHPDPGGRDEGLAMRDHSVRRKTPPLALLPPHPEMPDVVLSAEQLSLLKNLFLSPPPVTQERRVSRVMEELHLDSNQRSDQIIAGALASGWFSSQADPQASTAVQRDIFNNPANANGIVIRFAEEKGGLRGAQSAWYPDLQEQHLPVPRFGPRKSQRTESRRQLFAGLFTAGNGDHTPDSIPAEIQRSYRLGTKLFSTGRREFIEATIATLVYTGVLPSSVVELAGVAPVLSPQAQTLTTVFTQWHLPPSEVLAYYSTKKLLTPYELAKMPDHLAAYFRQLRSDGLVSETLSLLPRTKEVQEAATLLGRVISGDSSALQEYLGRELENAERWAETCERLDAFSRIAKEQPWFDTTQELQKAQAKRDALKNLPAKLSPAELREAVRLDLERKLKDYEEWRRVNEPKLREALGEGWQHYRADLDEEAGHRLAMRLNEQREQLGRQTSTPEEPRNPSPTPMIVLDMDFWNTREQAEQVFEAMSVSPELAQTFLGQLVWERVFTHEASHAVRGRDLIVQQAEERRVMSIEGVIYQGTREAFELFTMGGESEDEHIIDVLFRLLRQWDPELYRALAAPARYRILRRVAEHSVDGAKLIRDFVSHTYRAMETFGQPMTDDTIRFLASAA